MGFIERLRKIKIEIWCAIVVAASTVVLAVVAVLTYLG